MINQLIKMNKRIKYKLQVHESAYDREDSN